MKVLAALALVVAVLVSVGASVSGAETFLLTADMHQVSEVPYRVGPLTIIIRPQREVEYMCASRDQVHEPGRILGCYLPDSRTIVAVPDPYVILHELKHHFEGDFHPSWAVLAALRAR